MKKSTIGIVGIILRILSIISIALYVYYNFKIDEFNSLIDNGEIALAEYNELKNSIRFYVYAPIIFLIVDGFFSISIKKNRADRNISFREYMLPEFNYADERESVLTGKAARISLAVIIVYTTLLLFSYIFFVDVFNITPLLLVLTTTSTPIIGLIIYYLSYRYYYLK